MLALLEDIGGPDRCPIMGQNECFSEGSESYTVYNSPASSCIEDYNVAAEVEISRDISDQEYSFYDECLSNIETEIKLPWANLADLGETITEFSINECRNRQTEAEFSQGESVCSGDYWDRCNSWVNKTTGQAEGSGNNGTYKCRNKSKSKGKYTSKTRKNVEKMSWNEMTVDEQRETIEDLTQIVSSSMGLREQLDVIRILNPDAVVSAADTEFEIDLNLLNGNKLEKIRKYLHQHRIQTVKTAKSSSSSITSSTRKLKSKSTGELPHGSKGNQKTTKGRNALLTRVYKQLLKEKRSGLFHNEQVISISKKQIEKNNKCSGDEEEEEDDEDEIEIDILD